MVVAGVGCGAGEEGVATDPAADVTIASPIAATTSGTAGLDEMDDGPRLSLVPFVQSGRVWTASAGTLEASHDGTSLRLTPLAADPEHAVEPSSLVLRTDQISIGSRNAVLGSQVSTNGDGALAITSPNVVELLETHYGDIEQTWQFQTRPAGIGDLVIRIAVTGQSYVARTSTGLHFAGAGHLGFSYGNSHWLDANGADFQLVPAWDSGHIVLRVPRAVLESTGFPARLDPTITAEKAVDAPIAGSPTGFTSIPRDVAFSGAQYLAVWQDTRNDAGDIYATRLSTTGAVLDTLAIAIGKQSGLQLNPAVVFVNGQYLVVWENRATNELEAARVLPATGAVTTLGTIASSPLLGERKPRLAARGSEALLVFQTDDDVRGARYTSSNTFAPPFVIAASADEERDPTVAANPGGNYLVAWTRGIADVTTGTVRHAIIGQQVTAAGTLAGATIDISVGQSGELSPSASFIAGNFVVAWNKNFHGNFIYATRITAAGVVLDTHTETLTGTATTASFGGILLSTGIGATFPSLACTTTSCLLAWRDRRTFATTAYDVYSQLVDGTLAKAAIERGVSAGLRNQTTPRVSPAGNGYFVLWTDSRDGGPQVAYGSRVSSAGAVLDPNGILIARGNNQENSPSAARSSSSWLVGWTDSRVAGDNLLGTRLSNAFAVTDSPAINLSNAAASQGASAIATDPTTGNYLVVWDDNRLIPTKDIFAARVPQSGAVLDINGIAVTTAAADQIRPDVAAGSAGRFLVVWQDRRGGQASQFDIYGAVLDSAGAVVVPEFPISTAPLDQATPRVSYDPTSDRFLVVWVDQRAGGVARDIYSARVTPAGAVLDPTGVAIASDTVNAEIEPDVVFGTDRFLVVWRTGSDIHAARVRAGGVTIARDDAVDVVITSAVFKQSQPRVAYTGNTNREFVIVWADERTFATTASDIYGNTLNEATAALGGEYVVSNTVESEVKPTLSRSGRLAGAAMEVLASYQRYSVADNTFRVALRKLAFPTDPVLQSIAVTPANLTIPKGASQSYTAIGTFSDASTQNLTSSVTWSSSVPAVATITSAGVATGVAQGGPTTITATKAGVAGTTSLRVGPPVLVSITVNPVLPSIAKGTTQAFTASGTFSDGTVVDETTAVTWTSSAPGVATIASTGVATAVTQGDTEITARLGTFADSTTLSVTAAVLVDIAIEPVDPAIAKATTLQFTAIGTFSDGTAQDLTNQVTWSSSNGGIATISSVGLATGIAAGTTTITASRGGATDTSDLTVTNATLSSITVTPASSSIVKATTQQFTAIGTFSDSTTQDLTSIVVWSSTATAVATISNTGSRGLASGIAPGVTTIRATSAGRTGQTTLTVTEATLVSIAITPANPSLAKGFKLQFTAIGTFSNATTQNVTTLVTWTSSSNSIASISGSGLVTAKAVGTSTIRATRTGVVGTTLLTSTNATLTAIVVTPATLTLAIGQSSQLTAVGTFSNGTTLDITTQVSWKSSAKKRVSVKTTGIVKAVRSGSATITAVKNGRLGNSTVTVP